MQKTEKEITRRSKIMCSVTVAHKKKEIQRKQCIILTRITGAQSAITTPVLFSAAKYIIILFIQFKNDKTVAPSQ